MLSTAMFPSATARSGFNPNWAQERRICTAVAVLPSTQHTSTKMMAPLTEYDLRIFGTGRVKLGAIMAVALSVASERTPSWYHPNLRLYMLCMHANAP